MICPIKKTECLKIECAWWYPEKHSMDEGQCAIKLIPNIEIEDDD